MEGALRGSEPGLKLIETLLWDAESLVRLPRHLARLSRSARALGWHCELAAAEAALDNAVPQGPARMRLTLDAKGEIGVTAGVLAPVRPVWRLALARVRLESSDPWLSVKSSRRHLYDRSRDELPATIEELIFLNERDEVCEGTITNIFYDLGEGLRTPPLRSGLLPGVLREELLATGGCIERPFAAAELASARLWVGNSLRGLIPAEMAD
ncbi:aminotransferase class IV family protein [Paracoccus sp. MBLB3053]|uniref:Probable branched-chain-amino-acid aminotransferase n=1 Tax=Paracoccus aurantius TaxID=3073814 RepID=A0ABU2HRQ5_9RHOB|nr:aminotransferase class IV family protein [Paracoccus sp. MBLB3053]MDS9467698.1 aminotransferase class IV family protein [Paracoccus sp. MBLB3053]